MAFLALLPVVGGLLQTSAAQSTRPADWPAFHGGGALTGQAAPIGAPPMKLRWTYKVSQDEPVRILGSAAIVGQTVYVADHRGIVHAINLADGTKRWTYSAKEGFESSPLVMDGKVFIGDTLGTFHAIDAADGKPLWTFDAVTTIYGSANSADGKIIFGTAGADIFCLNPADGKPIWQQKANDRINGTPAVTDHVFVSGCDSVLRAFTVTDGRETSATELKSLCPGSPAIANGKIVVGIDGGVIQCFDEQTKKPLWTFEGVGNQAMVYSSPAIADGIVVAGARDRNVYALDLSTGEKKWNFPTRGDVDSSPLISGGRVYFGSADRTFYILDLKTGQELWTFAAGRGISAAPAIGQGVVVIADEAGSVFCLEPVGK